MFDKPLLFFTRILKNLRRKHKNGLASMKLTEILRSNLVKKISPKKVGFLRKSTLNIYRKTDPFCLFSTSLKLSSGFQNKKASLIGI